MWQTKQRTVLFLLLYIYRYHTQFLGLEVSDDDNQQILEINKVFEIYLDENYKDSPLFEPPSLDESEKQTYIGIIQDFKNSQAKLLNKLELYIKEWDKTNFILQTLLLLLETELESIQTKSPVEFTADKKKILVRSYLKLCQQYIDNEAVSLVHAVMIKIVG
jgi:hypothetical protein